MRKVILFLLFTSFSLIALAKPERTLEFEVYSPSIIDSNQKISDENWQYGGEAMFSFNPTNSSAIKVTEKINITDLSKEIETLSLLCDSLGNGQIRVWVKASIQGGLIVSAAGEGGLEITVACS